MHVDYSPADELLPEVRAWRARADERIRRLTSAYRDTSNPIFLFAKGDARLPIDLARYAGALAIKEVIFRRLLDRGGLSVDGDQFINYVGCSKDQIDRFSSDYLKNGGRNLPPAVRFTIAHELAHTFFFKLSQGKRVQVVSTDRYPVWEKIEAECDRVACQLLMPVDLGDARNRPGSDMDVLDPTLLITQAEVFGVTPRVFVERLQWRIGGITDRRGAVIYVRQAAPPDNTPRIKAWALSGVMREFLGRQIHYGADFRRLCNEGTLLVYGGNCAITRLTIQGRPVRVRCKADDESGFIVTMEYPSDSDPNAT
jgi:hypothetical protein